MSDSPESFKPGRLPWLWLITIFLLALTAVLPATGWLVPQQARSLVEAPNAVRSLLRDMGVRDETIDSAPAEKTSFRSYADQHPDDYDAQLAAVLGGADHAKVVPALRALATRFPNHPGLYAHALRYASARLSFRRDEEYALSGDPIPNAPTSSPPGTVDLEAFGRDAVAGERLDPQNGFFPLMRAAGLLAAHRDRDALEAVQRASRKARWNDYAAEEVRSVWKAREALNGRETALRKTVVLAAVLFPHYARMRQVARVAVYEAIEAEKAGKVEEGLAIRMALARCGDRMRAQSPTLIGSLVGIAITAISTSRPGGASPVKRPENVSVETWTKQRMENYAAYLKRIGHTEDALRALAAADEGKMAKSISQQGMTLSPAAGKPMVALMSSWIMGMLVLSNALWILLMALVTAQLARVRAKIGAVLGILFLGILVLAALAFNLSQWTEALAMLGSVEENLSGGATPGTPLAPGLVKVLTIAVQIGTPSLLSLGALIVAGARRRNPAAVLCRVLSLAALVFGLVFAGLSFYTARQEARVSQGLDRTLNGEGKYLAELLGKSWPGPAMD